MFLGIFIFLVIFVLSNALFSALFEFVVGDTARLILSNISALGVATVSSVTFVIKGIAQSDR